MGDYIDLNKINIFLDDRPVVFSPVIELEPPDPAPDDGAPDNKKTMTATLTFNLPRGPRWRMKRKAMRQMNTDPFMRTIEHEIRRNGAFVKIIGRLM